MVDLLEIEAWFDNGAPFNEGLAIYSRLPNQDTKVLKSFNRGENGYNKSLLIKELRAAMLKPINPVLKKLPPPLPKPTQPTTDASIAKEHTEKALKTKAADHFLCQITYAELPAELRVRYQEVRQIFYQLCDLKFLLNDVPKKSEKEALVLQLQIEEQDEKRSAIWAELEHWKKHKTMLPTKTSNYNGMSDLDLDREKRNLMSMITKMQQRIDKKYNHLSEETDTTKAIKLERSINNSEKKLHQHRLNLAKIKELL